MHLVWHRSELHDHPALTPPPGYARPVIGLAEGRDRFKDTADGPTPEQQRP